MFICYCIISLCLYTGNTSVVLFSFSASKLFIGQQEGHLVCKNLQLSSELFLRFIPEGYLNKTWDCVYFCLWRCLIIGTTYCDELEGQCIFLWAGPSSWLLTMMTVHLRVLLPAMIVSCLQFLLRGLLEFGSARWTHIYYWPATGPVLFCLLASVVCYLSSSVTLLAGRAWGH